MFTGLVQQVGSVSRSSRDSAGDLDLGINCGSEFLVGVVLGDSIAVNGVCLTVVKLDSARFDVNVSSESLQHTRLADLKSGALVNLEKALTLQSPLGGHLVSGHVDGLATIVDMRKDARSWRFELEAASDVMRYVVTRGSICIDGVSLTVTEADDRRFKLNIIPHTAEHTIISGYARGSQVHVEVDMLARYAEKLLFSRNEPAGRQQTLSQEFLAKNGFWK